MTFYELQDLRMSLLERFNARQNFWLTVTFAVFGALYLAGPALDTFSKVLLGVFYFSVTLLAWIGTERTAIIILAVTRDIEIAAEKEAPDLEISKAEKVAGVTGRSIGWINRGLMIGSVVAFVIYATTQNG